MDIKVRLGKNKKIERGCTFAVVDGEQTGCLTTVDLAHMVARNKISRVTDVTLESVAVWDASPSTRSGPKVSFLHLTDTDRSGENLKPAFGTIFKLRHCPGDLMGGEPQTAVNPKHRQRQPKLTLESNNSSTSTLLQNGLKPMQSQPFGLVGLSSQAHHYLRECRSVEQQQAKGGCAGLNPVGIAKLQ
ncbi:hypothetical protein C8R45DRAFT_945046 [Mycena sanguinolenta]|nr:hypothetical protein C8R45DRAFT_945046 [Mycena sanguinolenta]